MQTTGRAKDFTYPNGKGYMSLSDGDSDDDEDSAAAAEQLQYLCSLVQCGIDMAAADVIIAEAQQYEQISSHKLDFANRCIEL